MSDEKRNKVLIKEIAGHIGVSPGTVSVVLNGRGDTMRISKTTQRRVLDAAKEMNYQQNIYARRLRDIPNGNGTGKVVGIFWCDRLIDAEMGGFFNGIHHTMKGMDYDIEMCIRPFDIGELYKHKDAMTPSRYSGLIVYGASDEDMVFLDENDFELPIVLIGRNSEKYHSVHSNYYEVGKNTARLFSQRGHSKVGMLSLKHRIYGSSLRQLGFLEGCDIYHMQIRSEWLHECEARDYKSGYAAAKEMINGTERPTAVFITTLAQALGCAAAYREAGFRIPEDLEILAFGNNPLLSDYLPSISTVHIQVDTMAECALSLLMLVIDNKIDIPMSRLVFGEYSFRDSCGGFPNSSVTESQEECG